MVLWLIIVGEPLLVLYRTYICKVLYSTFVKWCYIALQRWHIALYCFNNNGAKIGLGRLFIIINFIHYENTSISITCICTAQWSTTVPGHSIYHHIKQVAANKLTHYDLKRGSIWDRNPTIRCFLSPANCEGYVTAVQLPHTDTYRPSKTLSTRAGQQDTLLPPFKHDILELSACGRS